MIKKILLKKILMKKIIVKNKYFSWKSNFKNVFFEGKVLKISFMREQFWKCVFLRKHLWECLFWGSNFGNVFLWKQIWEINFEGAMGWLSFRQIHSWLIGSYSLNNYSKLKASDHLLISQKSSPKVNIFNDFTCLHTNPELLIKSVLSNLGM